ncbi:MAG: pyrroline-5-carboxylate reductase [Chloroflexota bacterium]
MLEHSKIVFVGSGNMGEAMIKGILAHKLAAPGQITACDILESRLDYMASTYDIRTSTDSVSAIEDASIVVLSIKPQVLSGVGSSLHRKAPPDALVLSIIAGASLETLSHGMGHSRVVRSMPNTPAQVNMGVTCWIASPDVTDGQKEQTRAMLGALGDEIEVQKEDFLDMQTGLGGSGPGFVFLIIEAMIDAGVQMGFSRDQAQTIALQTIAGSVELVKATGEHPAALRNKVTSPGGTTAAGIYALEKGGLRTVLTDAIFAAYRRSQELGKIT